VVTRVRATAGDVLRFSSGRFVRVLAARWIGVEPTLHAAAVMLSMAGLSALGYEHDLSRPVIRLWNDTKHVRSGGELKYEGSRALKALG
jgi:probable phosphoglycerate mutase